MQESDPDDLLSKALEGDKVAFAQLYARLYNQLKPTVRSHWSKSRTSVLNDLFIKLLEKDIPKTFTSHGKFKSFLTVVARNLLIDTIRASSRWQSDVNIERITDHRMHAGEVEVRLAEVCERFEMEHGKTRFDAYVMRELHGYSYEKIAKDLNTSIRTAKRHVQRIREAVQSTRAETDVT